MSNYNNLCLSTTSRIIFFIFLLVSHASLLADDTLKPFSAKYNVYRNDQHVADTYFNLQFINHTWTWSMGTRPTGLFKWLTRKKPFTETRMTETAEGFRLLHVSSGDYREKPATENTFFDHDNRLIYYVDTETSKVNQLPLPEDLYSYHDIHLLYARMKESGQTQIDIHFYKTGNVFKSSLSLETQVEIPYQSDKIIVDRMTQTVMNSNKTMIYYYHQHPLAPIKIEQFKEGKPNTMMWRTSVENPNREKTSSLPQ